MLNGNIPAYSGMTTKIRAMKKKLLSPAQYEEISRFSTVSELINFLQTIPSYAGVLASIDSSNAHRGEIESRMTFSAYSDFSKIYHFAGTAQRKYLEVYFMQYENAVIKAYMRNIMDSRTETSPILTDKHFRRHSQLDINKLAMCATMDDLVECLAGTIYETPIKKVHKLENPILFDYEMTLDIHYFTHVYKHQNMFIPKGERNSFMSSFGPQMDLLNILWIYRCKNYYNLSDSQIYSFLIPIYYNVDRSFIKELVESRSNQELFELISNCYYGKTYGFDSTQPMESQFEDIINTIYMKNFKDSPYSLACITAYLHLKNLEIAKVVTAMECIRYGYKPEVISQYIDQKRGVL